jgi:hypothetical protein
MSRALRSRLCVAWLATLALVVVGSPSSASAEGGADKTTCARAYEHAQRLRQAGELRAASVELRVCAQADCPALLRQDCVPWLGQVEAAIPSIVVAAHASDGSLRGDVRVVVDGTVVAEHVGPDAIPLDPGDHVVRIEVAGAQGVEQRVVLRSGDGPHTISVTFSTAVASPPAAPAATPAAPETPAAVERPVPPWLYVLGAAGVAITGAGTYFQIDGLSKRSSLNGCSPTCSPGAVSDARNTLWVGNVALGVGIVTLAAAVWLYLARPAVPAAQAGILSGRF